MFGRERMEAVCCPASDSLGLCLLLPDPYSSTHPQYPPMKSPVNLLFPGLSSKSRFTYPVMSSKWPAGTPDSTGL